MEIWKKMWAGVFSEHSVDNDSQKHIEIITCCLLCLTLWTSRCFVNNWFVCVVSTVHLSLLSAVCAGVCCWLAVNHTLAIRLSCHHSDMKLRLQWTALIKHWSLTHQWTPQPWPHHTAVIARRLSLNHWLHLSQWQQHRRHLQFTILASVYLMSLRGCQHRPRWPQHRPRRPQQCPRCPPVSAVNSQHTLPFRPPRHRTLCCQTLPSNSFLGDEANSQLPLPVSTATWLNQTIQRARYVGLLWLTCLSTDVF